VIRPRFSCWHFVAVGVAIRARLTWLALVCVPESASAADAIDAVLRYVEGAPERRREPAPAARRVRDRLALSTVTRELPAALMYQRRSHHPHERRKSMPRRFWVEAASIASIRAQPPDLRS
jgi:hypothetical protein